MGKIPEFKRFGLNTNSSRSEGFGLGPERAQALARVGLVFGLSPQARPRACPPGQAWPAIA
jgi:hypothetical protein